MYRFALLAVAVICFGAISASADDKKDTPKGRQLPSNWGKLGLSDEQRDKVYSVQGEYKSKIEELTKQLSELKKKEKEALFAILTEGQLARLKEILLEAVPEKKPVSKPATTTESKPPVKNDK